MADPAPSPDDSPLVLAVTAWFDAHERPLPWRSTTPWGVLVSEFMLQQTPVNRVLPVWGQWMERWPTPERLAEATIGEAVRAWGRLGYPRRARRLHESAVAIRDEHGGEVPDDEQALRSLPGVGEYTAAAVRAFAFGRRSIVLDTNVRRVLVRARDGQALPSAHLTRAERDAANALWPTDDRASAHWSAAVMELGALVCSARVPACERCPLTTTCRWQAEGRPRPESAPRRQPRFEGSDRQARGALLAVLRDAAEPVQEAILLTSWPDDAQAQRALGSLVADGLVERLTAGGFGLPD